MNIIKFTNKTNLKLNNVKYKAYLIGDLPPSFGFKYNDTKQGISKWFNYKGLTWEQIKNIGVVYYEKNI